MNEATREVGREAIRSLDRVIGQGSDIRHTEVQAAVMGVIALRNRLIAEHREGRADPASLAQANALVSLAYGAEFPLTGFHRHRFEKTRDALKALIDAE